MQKKNPLYSQLKEDTVWSMESFNAYVNDRFQVAKGLPRDWVLGAFAVSAMPCRRLSGTNYYYNDGCWHLQLIEIVVKFG